MSKVTGVIEAQSRNKQSILINEVWYRAFKVDQLKGAVKGDKVSFDEEVATKGDQTFHNIKGDVTIVDGASNGSAPRASSGGSAGASSGGASVGNRDRSIVRQNSLTQANALFRTVIGESGVESEDDMASMAQELIDVARLFEAYSMGEV